MQGTGEDRRREEGELHEKEGRTEYEREKGVARTEMT